MTKFIYYSLAGLAAVRANSNEYIEKYRADDTANAPLNNPPYYDDKTSTYRVPGWVKNDYFIVVKKRLRQKIK